MNQKIKGDMEKFRNSFDNAVKDAEEVFLVAHAGLDDDAVGSLLATYFYLTEHLKVKESVRMLVTGVKPERYSSIEGYELVESVRDISSHVKDGFVVFLDGSSWERFSGEEKVPLKFSVCIDHHSSDHDEYELSLLVPGFSSTAELVYHAFFGREKKLGGNVCEALLLGILGDTGNFSFAHKNISSVFLVAERLVREGDISVQDFQAKYNYISRETFGLFARIVSNAKTSRVGEWPEFVFSYVENSFVGDYDAVNEAAHIFTDYMRKIKGVYWGFVVSPRNGFCSVSFRSLPKRVNVRKIAESFGGGGHDLAAGCGIEERDCVRAKDIILKWLENNNPWDYSL